MDAAEELIQLKEQLQVALKKGWFEITRAKYAMGPIGSAQYRSDTQASTTISTCSMTDSHARGGRGSPAPAGPFTLHQQPLSSRPVTHHHSSSDSGDDSNGGADVPASLEAFLLRMQANSLHDHPPRASCDATAGGGAKPHPTAPSPAETSAPNNDRSRDVSGSGAQAEAGSGGSSDSGNTQPAGHTTSRHTADAAAASTSRSDCGDSDPAERDRGGDGPGAGESKELERELLEEGADDSDAEDENERGREGRKQKAVLRGVAPNPLHWFGVLVPRAMRDAQSSFQRAVVLCARIANLSHRISSGLGSLEGGGGITEAPANASP
ncbi:MAG: hypothetical protein WDW38_007359 [Sanguina aurantia]